MSKQLLVFSDFFFIKRFLKKKTEDVKRLWLIMNFVICITAINTGFPQIRHLYSHNAGIGNFRTL